MGPHVGRIMSYEDGNVANDSDAALARIVTQRVPLAIENKLEKLLLRDGSGKFCARFFHRRRFAKCEFTLPGSPFAVAVRRLQSSKHRIIVEPPGSVGAEFTE